MQVRPIVLRSDDHFVSLLRGRREALGMSQEDVDARVGWADCFCAKAEAPHRRFGRRVCALFAASAFEWLESLGLSVVLMDTAQAEALRSASEAPEIEEARHRVRDGFSGARKPVVVQEMRTRVRVAI